MGQYAQLAAPLTDLLRKNNFHWDESTLAAFNTLKEKLITAPVLIYPNFSLPFVIETDACDVGVGAVLIQRGHPVAYYSKKLSPLRQRASTYAKELWAITEHEIDMSSTSTGCLHPVILILWNIIPFLLPLGI